ncbi:MAG: hypothetical protein JXC36_08710 [Candidatus Atribacteria bacterium]|nr:hypothetical protein [Candidatus Atribacteria bacterium]
MDMEDFEKTMKEIREFNKNMMTKEEHKRYASLIIEKQNKIIELANEMLERLRARSARFYEEINQDNQEKFEQNNS